MLARLLRRSPVRALAEFGLICIHRAPGIRRVFFTECDRYVSDVVTVANPFSLSGREKLSFKRLRRVRVWMVIGSASRVQICSWCSGLSARTAGRRGSSFEGGEAGHSLSVATLVHARRPASSPAAWQLPHPMAWLLFGGFPKIRNSGPISWTVSHGTRKIANSQKTCAGSMQSRCQNFDCSAK